MQLPLSSTACLARFGISSGGYTQIQSSNSTATIAAIIDEVSGLGAVAPSVATSPTHTRSPYHIAGSYSSATFNGSSQLLTFNSLAATVATLQSFAMFMVVTTATPATSNMDLFSFGKTSGDGYIQAFISGSAAGISCKDDAAVVTAPATAGVIDTKPHLYSLIRDVSAGTLVLRLDGATIITSSVSGTFTPTTCSIGALVNNGTTGRYLNGNISEIAVFANQKSNVSTAAIETYFVDRYLEGLNRVV